MTVTEIESDDAALAGRLERLRGILRECGSVCIGYSGGVDSAFLAKAALDTLGPSRVLAVTGLSPAYPQVQRDTAARCARELGIPHVEIETRELSDARYAANPSNRCYFCKSELWPQVTRVARERGLAVVLDGSNADDAHDFRPGFAAAREHGVRAPLLEAGLTKADVRELSRRAALPTWDQPSAPCLSSRLPYGVPVTPERLRVVERAEEELRALGFRELRVRHHDDCLRIELAPAELPRALPLAGAITDRLTRITTARVLIDGEGYRRGALNEALVQIGSTGGRALAPSAQDAVSPRHNGRQAEVDVAGHHRDIAVLHATELAAVAATAPALRAAGYRYIALDLERVATASAR